MALVNERWLPVCGYECHYEVSDQGRVRSLKFSRKLLLSQSLRGKYLGLGLWLNGEQKQVRIYQLVLEAFVGSCPRGMEGSHLDDNAWNNRLSNLVWESRSANCKRRSVPLRDKSRNRKLSMQKAKEIRRLHRKGARRKGLSISALARLYGVHPRTVCRALSGERWT